MKWVLPSDASESVLAPSSEALEIMLQGICEEVERSYDMGGLSDGLYADYAKDVARIAIDRLKKAQITNLP